MRHIVISPSQFHFHIPALARLKPDTAERYDPPVKVCRFVGFIALRYDCACVIMACNAHTDVTSNVARYESDVKFSGPAANNMRTSQISENRSMIKRSTSQYSLTNVAQCRRGDASSLVSVALPSISVVLPAPEISSFIREKRVFVRNLFFLSFLFLLYTRVY